MINKNKEIKYDKVIFQTNVDRGIDPECHLCINHCKDSNGYVRIKSKSYNGFQFMHRYVYWKLTGKKPEVIRHKCDHPDCININHLEGGTHADNVKDRVERNRSAVGEHNGRSKLTQSDVIEIRKLVDMGKTDSSIARKFNVSRRTIYSIRNKTSWKRLDDDTDIYN